MIQYNCTDISNYTHLNVRSAVGDVVVELEMREDFSDGAATLELNLHRDAVAALVGQLQSWLARTAPTEAAR